MAQVRRGGGGDRHRGRTEDVFGGAGRHTDELDVRSYYSQHITPRQSLQKILP